MHSLDDTDLEILSLLGADGRRPYSEIADRVGLSGPAVSERVARLEEAGVIDRFTIDVDRSQLSAGTPVFVRVTGVPGDSDGLRSTLADAAPVEHVFVTAAGDLWFQGRVAPDGVRDWLADLLPDGATYDVTLLDDVAWTPSFDDAAFALTCAECGNTVDEEGESTRVDGDVYHFCCPVCRERFTDRYRSLDAGT